MVEVPRQQDPRAPAPCLLVRWLFEPEWSRCAHSDDAGLAAVPTRVRHRAGRDPSAAILARSARHDRDVALTSLQFGESDYFARFAGHGPEAHPGRFRSRAGIPPMNALIGSV